MALLDGAFTAEHCRIWCHLHGMRHRVIKRTPGPRGIKVLADVACAGGGKGHFEIGFDCTIDVTEGDVAFRTSASRPGSVAVGRQVALLRHVRGAYRRQGRFAPQRPRDSGVGAVAPPSHAREFRRSFALVRFPPAIAIVGFHGSTMGLGEDARTLADACLRIGVRPELIDVSPPSLEPSRDAARYRAFEAEAPSADTVVFCLPPPEMRRACDLLGFGAADGRRHRIGYWPWETSALSAALDGAFDLVDELWASTTFLMDLYRASTPRPVRRVPLAVTVEPPALTAELAGLLDGRFTVLSVFDFHSRVARKNPFGAVAAFRRAFPQGTEPVQMILKTINGERRQDDLVALLAETFEDPRIAVVDGAVDRAALCGLIAASDVYLSLHRAEGFGRPIAEAMLLGTPVVATGWSGPADFLDEATGYPIGSHLRPVRADEYPFAAGRWAEPDVEQAAGCLAALHIDPASRRRTCAAARRRVVDLFGPAAVDHALSAALSA